MYLLIDLLVYFSALFYLYYYFLFTFLQFFSLFPHLFLIIFIFPDLIFLIHFTDFSFKNKQTNKSQRHLAELHPHDHVIARFR